MRQWREEGCTGMMHWREGCTEDEAVEGRRLYRG